MHNKHLRQLLRFCKGGLNAIALFVGLILLSPTPHAAEEFLDPAVAFRFSARMADAKTAEVTYTIADGYYMYRERFKFSAEGAKLGAPAIPAGDVKFDETFQKNVETYHHKVVIRLPVEASGPFTLKSTGQGCAEKGLCYPPQESNIVLTPPTGAALKGSVSAAGNGSDGGNILAQGSDTGVVESAIKGGKLMVILPLFFLLGLGLSLTPCVLPMVPILTSIIVGEGSNVTRRRGLTLSATYSLGMAIVYTALGVAAGLVGEGLAATFQNPWVLSAFALLIAVLSLSMFDVYQLQTPAAIQHKLIKASDRQAAGKLAGVFAMGALSGLIIGPCVTAPLIAVLVLISQTHDAWLGGGILFTTAIGMSVPLLLVGFSAGWLLPHTGMWMDAIKRFFGVMLLGVALWMVSPVLNVTLQMLAWAALLAGYGVYLLSNKRLGMLAKACGLAFAVLGLVQLVGAGTGARDVFAPLAQVTSKAEKKVEFVRIKSAADLDAALAKAGGKAVMLDFYADWCVSCKEMEKLTFSDAHIQQRFADMVLLQADVTANDGDDKALLKRFNLFGPPGIIFFDKSGKEIGDGRVVGYQDADKFALSLARVFQRDAG
jgi:thiol:disulfide interchange protein DsbD